MVIAPAMAGALALVLAANAPPRCTVGTEEVPPLCPLMLPRVRSVSIERNGARQWADAEGPPSCTRFRLSAVQVRRYLERARTTDRGSADATLDRSPCYAAGRVRYVDGRVGRWRIEQFGVGRLALPGRPEMLLFCPACRERPFRW